VYLLEFAGEDDALATHEAGAVLPGARLLATGLGVAGTAAGVERLAFTRRASELLARTAPTVADARRALSAAPLDREGSVAVRARDVRASADVDTQRAERVLGRALVERGFGVDLDDPDHRLVAAFAGPPDAGSADEGSVEGTTDGADAGDPSPGVCALGWVVAEPERTFGERRPTDRPFFQPGSMDPLLARAVANLAGAGPGRVVVDPMCGTGGVLVEAGLAGARVVGLDAQAKMVAGARRNLRAYLDGDAPVVRADAARLPLRADAADGVVVDVPYGRQSAIRGDLADLVGGVLRESRRVAPRAVVVADRSWADLAREAGWTVAARIERRVHRSLVRHVHVLCEG
jgi:tRNA (guanine10-N2)-dimethyltransferase